MSDKVLLRNKRSEVGFCLSSVNTRYNNFFVYDFSTLKLNSYYFVHKFDNFTLQYGCHKRHFHIHFLLGKTFKLIHSEVIKCALH